MKPQIRSNGFTLIELLVTIVIIAVLAVTAFVVAGKAVMKAQRTTALAQMRDAAVGIESYTVDYRRPPVPKSKRDTGWDTIYGDPGGLYSNASLMGALMGSDEEFSTGTGEIFAGIDMNPKGNVYIEPRIVDNKKNGVGRDDGKLYDPWGREIIFAVNTPPFRTKDAGGKNDKRLMTWGLAEYSDKKPREQAYIVWSYGKDGLKADAYAGADDVANW